VTSLHTWPHLHSNNPCSPPTSEEQKDPPFEGAQHAQEGLANDKGQGEVTDGVDRCSCCTGLQGLKLCGDQPPKGTPGTAAAAAAAAAKQGPETACKTV